MTPINPFLNPFIQKWDSDQLFSPKFAVNLDSLVKSLRSLQISGEK
jgi:hypothetical protein